jgi:hypothetical protein
MSKRIQSLIVLAFFTLTPVCIYTVVAPITARAEARACTSTINEFFSSRWGNPHVHDWTPLQWSIYEQFTNEEMVRLSAEIAREENEYLTKQAHK